MPFVAQPVEKCTACAKTVYQTEKAVVEDKTDKRVYHKSCIRCQTCNKVLSIGTYSSLEGKFWCKPHFKQLFATKGNYDEAFGIEKSNKWENTAPVSTPTSFIPEVKSEKPAQSNNSSDTTVAKFKQFREEGDSNKCVSCGKTVYAAEKMLVEDKNDKRLFHKICFKCSVCGMQLDLRNYGSADGKIYCKKDMKDQQKPSATGFSGTPSSFIPAVEEKKSENKSSTPEGIASKFKSMETEKCKACGKSVYATEKATLAENNKQSSVYHKTCLKCSVCNCKLDISNYGSANGVLFCQVHLKQFGKPEQANGGYFVSPLANADTNYVPGPKEGEVGDNYDSPVQKRRNEEDSDSENSRRESQQQQERDDNNNNLGSSSTSLKNSNYNEDVEAKSSPQVERASRSLSSSSANNDRPASNNGSARSSPAPERRAYTSSSTNDDDDGARREAERQKKRQERQKQIEEEERQAEEERQKRKMERERRLAEASDDTSESSGGGAFESRDAEREERRRKREEERQREEEQREREEAKRKKEREERKRQQEEEAQREFEEAERKAEERRRKIAELKNNS